MTPRTLLLMTVVLGTLQTSARQPSIKRLDGSQTSPAEIDRTVLRLMQAAEVSGVGVSIFNQGKTVYSKAYGFRDVQNKLPLTVDTVMTGASFTKVDLPTSSCSLSITVG